MNKREEAGLTLSVAVATNCGIIAASLKLKEMFAKLSSGTGLSFKSHQPLSFLLIPHEKYSHIPVRHTIDQIPLNIIQRKRPPNLS